MAAEGGDEADFPFPLSDVSKRVPRGREACEAPLAHAAGRAYFGA